MCAYLTCAHYLPIGRATTLMQTLTGLHLATGFTARARRRPHGCVFCGEVKDQRVHHFGLTSRDR